MLRLISLLTAAGTMTVTGLHFASLLSNLYAV